MRFIKVKKCVGLFVLTIGLLAAFACAEKTADHPATRSPLPTKPEIPFEGRIVFQSNMEGTHAVYLMTSDVIQKLTQNSWDNKFPVWSPDGTRIAFHANPEGPNNIYIMNADGSDPTQMTTSGLDEMDPAWFPDGRHLAFSQERKRLLRRNIELFKIDLETRRIESLMPDFPDTHGIPHVSPVDPLILFTGKRSMGWDAGIYNLETGNVVYLGDRGQTCRARFSPDGRKVAFVSSEAGGREDIWIANADGTGKRRLTDRGDVYDYFPSWSPDGRFIVFSSSLIHDMEADWALSIVEVETREVRVLLNTPGSHVFPDWTRSP